MSDVYETLYYEGEIERLKIELAEAKAKIRAAREIALQTWSDRLDFLHALGVESASPIRYSEAARGSEGAT